MCIRDRPATLVGWITAAPQRLFPALWRLAVPTVLYAGIVNAADMREWTDLQNRRIEGRMLGLAGDVVSLELKDGHKVSVPLAKLSAADAAYARSQNGSAHPPESGKSALNFDAPWPDRIKFGEDPEIATVEEDAANKHFVYESANYRYTCDARLSKSVVKGFAVLFEATHLFCRTLPLALDDGKKTDGKLQILLFKELEDYQLAGGRPGSAGIFMSGKASVMVPLTSLGVRPIASGFMLDREKSSQSLPHELTHQLTPRSYFEPGAMGWFSEGIAEYVAVTPYRSGAYSVRNNHDDIIAYVTGTGTKNMGGRKLGKDIRLPDLKTFLTQDYDSFLEAPQLNYGSGLLLTYYFLQMDGAGDGQRIKGFLKALRDSKTGDDALAILLDGRSYEELATEISKAWKRRGVNLTFSSAK